MTGILKFRKWNRTFLSIFAGTMLVSCDPPHNIFFKNSSAREVEVKINFQPGAERFRRHTGVQGDSLVFKLKKGESTNIFFGIGIWSEEAVKQVSQEIKTLEMSADNIIITYDGSNSIENLLINNREGWRGWQTDIEIDAGEYLERCQ